jgi:hypothetical protein
LKRYKTDLEAWKKKQATVSKDSRPPAKGKNKTGTSNDKPTRPKKPIPHMQKDEPYNFLRLATALKIFLGSSVKKNMIPRATKLLQDYLCGFRKVSSSFYLSAYVHANPQLYGEDQMKPNHHWAVHLSEQILDYGPVYSFWSFLPERLNKVMKNMNSNNWTGGQLEISMMREFNRGARMDGLVIQ